MTKPKTSPLGEKIQYLAKELRRQLRQVPSPLPHTLAFVVELDAFIVGQREHLASAVEAAAIANRSPVARHAPPMHHYMDDLACPVCGTDSSVGCIAGGGGPS